jgi:hypothetical protein
MMDAVILMPAVSASMPMPRYCDEGDTGEEERWQGRYCRNIECLQKYNERITIYAENPTK